MSSLLGAVIFVGFLCLVLAAFFAAYQGDEARIRRHVNRLIAYTVIFSLVAGISHIELWPFSRWNIFSEKLEQPVHQILVLAVDSNGREYDVDHRAFEPFTSIDLYTWFDLHFAELSPEQKDEVGRYLLERLNAARQRALAGERVGSFDRYFGRLAAPVHMLYARIWDDPARIPPTPFVGLRIYVERWNVFDRQRSQGNTTRTLLYEYPSSRRGR